ncbi:MAG: hypothetical protein AAF252_08435, partial [Pseudomonadota bacterium]
MDDGPGPKEQHRLEERVREELFVSRGRQFIPFAGVAELEPGTPIGTASAPLVRVPVSTLQKHAPAQWSHLL